MEAENHGEAPQRKHAQYLARRIRAGEEGLSYRQMHRLVTTRLGERREDLFRHGMPEGTEAQGPPTVEALYQVDAKTTELALIVVYEQRAH